MKNLLPKYVFFLILTIVLLNKAYAQTDREFWFAAPDFTSGHGNDEPIYLRFATFDVEATVRVELPAYNGGAGYLIEEFTMGIQDYYSIDLTSIKSLIETNHPVNPQPYETGIHITSTNLISVYYEFDQYWNQDIFSLKGKNALGKHFIAPLQNMYISGWANYNPDPLSTINIVATGDATQVRITLSNADMEGHLAGSSFDIFLDEGETYVVKANVAPGAGHLGGTIVEVIAGDDIAITICDDSIQDTGTCWDTSGDQIVPSDVPGKEYIVMKGPLPATRTERAFVYPVADNTEIWVDGASIGSYDILNPAVVVIPDAAEAVHIKGDTSLYVFHITGTSCELGGALLPTIDGCTGSLQVTYFRSNTDDFWLTLMTKDANKDAFWFEYEDGTKYNIPDTWFTAVGTTGWVVLEKAHYKFADGTGGGIPEGQATKIINTKDVFHLGIINGDNGVTCKYGYFSDFVQGVVSGKVVQSASAFGEICENNPLQLFASGGKTYKWTPSDFMDDPNSATPWVILPAGVHDYEVTIARPCLGDTTIDVQIISIDAPDASFTLSDYTVCAPFDVEVYNNSDIISDRQDWNFDFDNDPFAAPIITTDPVDTFVHTFYNSTSSDTTYNIRLISRQVGNPCVDIFYNQIHVKPEIYAGFDQDNIVGCNPLLVQFTDTSSGNLDKYKWTFDDGGQNTIPSPLHEFKHVLINDTVEYDVELVVTSPYFCRDTARKTISVYPYLDPGFTIDQDDGCSPFTVRITNTSSGADTIYLDYGDGTDTVMTAFNFIDHFYENNDGVDEVDTNIIVMRVRNNEGCEFIERDTIIVYPEITANYTIDPYSECNTDTLTFNNLSNFGTHKTSLITWTFGDGTNSNSVAPTIDHIYKNVSTTDKIYTFTLHAESQYGCYDDTLNQINMYRAYADFYVDTIDGCSPVAVNVVNNSIGTGITNWDWDYGDGIGTSTDENPPTYVYNNTGFETDTNMLVLEVTGTNGCSSKDSIEMKIFPEIHIDAITPLNQLICDSTAIGFTSSIIDPALSGVSYVWNFGDGASSPLANPTHMYRNLTAAQVTYPVSLAVETPEGCSDATGTNVFVDPYSNASYVINVSEGCSPLDIVINNNSRGGIYRWYWNSATAAGPEDYPSGDATEEIHHTYINNSGVDQIFYLTLIAENLNGCQDTLTREILVHSSVKAIFDTDDGIYAGCTPDTVVFDNQTDPASDAEFFSWNFNDGTSGASTKASPDITHRFTNTTNNDITYTVRLIAESAYGCTHDTTLDITVYSNVVANFSITDNEGCPPFETTVLNTSIGNAANNYEWQIDGAPVGGSPVDKSPFTHIYDNVDHLNTLDYQVKLIAENVHGCSSEKFDTITVFEDVTAGFTMDIDNGCNPLVVDFTDASLVPPLTTYIWDFGDGASSGADSPDHTFYNPSRVADLNYTIEQIVLSANYCSDTITDQVTVYHNPISKFWIDRTSSCPDLIANMNNFDSDGYDSFEWRFGDGTTNTTDQMLSHTYPNTLVDVVQNYTLEHWVTTVNGCSDSANLILNVFPDVIADFTLSTNAGCNPVTVSFDSDPSSDPAKYFYWDFGGDGTSNDIAPVHTFTSTWPADYTYDIMLVARSEFDCRDTIFKPVTAYVQPIAEFDIAPIVQKFPNSEITLKNKTLPSAATFNYLWEFGDGETSNAKDPVTHLYDHWGEDIEVKLTVNSPTSTCSDEIAKLITILPPDINADFIVDRKEGCLQDGFEVNFTAASSAYSETYEYAWEFGDGKTETGQIVSHNYEKAGVYYVKLTATGLGGEDYEYETIRVYSNPIANFEVSPRSSMLNYDLVARVEFFNLSECNDTSGCAYLWDFGDGETAISRDVTHNYTDLGFYDVGLTVTSAHGCVDSLLKVEEVEVLGAGTIKFPNAFTPNGDGLNDVFRPVSEGVIKYELLVYTRWGELIFTTKDLNAGWDGKINGELAKPDVYVWKAEGKFTNGRAFELAGDVTLVK